MSATIDAVEMHINYSCCSGYRMKFGCECNQSDTQHHKHVQEPQSPCAAVEMLKDLAIDGKASDRKWLRQGKKMDLIRRGQSGWAGPGFDRSPSPSSLPMPPSELLERACQTDLSDTSF